MTTEIKYFLGTYNNPEINTCKELSENDFKTCIQSMTALKKLSDDDNLFRIIELNYNDLKSNIESYLLTFPKTHKADFYEFDHMIIDINRLILNLLSSIRTFLDHSETKIKREYGKASEEYELFKTETNTAYDNNFSYRFLYKLRNFAQHCGLPSGSAELNSSITKNDVLNLYFLRDELLSKYEGWGAVRNELMEQSQMFDVLPLLDEKYILLKNIHEKVSNKIASNYRTQSNLLLNLLLILKDEVGIPCLIKSIASGDTAKLTFSWFPFDHISKITGNKINVVYTDEAKRE